MTLRFVGAPGSTIREPHVRRDRGIALRQEKTDDAPREFTPDLISIRACGNLRFSSAIARQYSEPLDELSMSEARLP